MLVFNHVGDLGVQVVANVFASRERVARILGTDVPGLHAQYQRRSRQRTAPRLVQHGPVLDLVQRGDQVDLRQLPMLRHFESDRGPYITNAILIAEHPDTGVGNMSYHRSMVHSPTEIATSLHSRGDLWRLVQLAKERGQVLPVAMVIGAHPLIMLAASARLPFDADEREVAGGLLGQAMEVVATPGHGLQVPAWAELVLDCLLYTSPSPRDS